MSTSKDMLPAVVQRGIIAAKTGSSLKEVAALLVENDAVEVYAPAEFPPVAPRTVITAEHEAALEALPGVFGQVQPETRRALTDDERLALYREFETLKKVTGLLDGRLDAIKTSIRHDFDVQAEEAGVAVPKAVVRGGHVVVEASPRDVAGHYVLGSKGKPERLPIPGTNVEWSREMRSGTLNIDGSLLEALAESGEVSREDYLAMTREVRVFDEKKAMEAIVKNPERLNLLRRITRRTGIGSALTTRNAR